MINVFVRRKITKHIQEFGIVISDEIRYFLNKNVFYAQKRFERKLESCERIMITIAIVNL